MKKYISLLLLLSGLFASSCQKEAGIDDGYDRFTACQEGSSTKTVLGDDLTPMWTPDEQISIYDGKNNAFAAELTAPAASSVFKGKLSDRNRKNYLAASPYSEDYTFMFLTKAVYNMMLPAEQTAVKDSYDPKALISVAYSTDKNFNFKNLCSLIKFTVGSDGVTSVEIESRDETPLSGRLDAICDEGTIPELSLYKGEVSPSVVLKGNFEKGATYYVTTLPAVLESGFTVTMNGDVVTRKETMPVSFARSGMINLGTISLDPKENVLPGQDGSDDGNQGGGNDGGDGNGNQGGNDGGDTGGNDNGNQGGNDSGNTGGDQGGNDGGDVSISLLGDYKNLYIWCDGVDYILNAWPGTERTELTEIDGKTYSKFLFDSDEVGEYLNREIYCIGIGNPDDADNTKTPNLGPVVFMESTVVTPQISEIANSIVIYAEGDFDTFYMWADGVMYVGEPWPGKGRDGVPVSIDGKTYTRFTYEVSKGFEVNGTQYTLGDFLGKEINCKFTKGSYETQNSDKIILKALNVLRFDNEKPVVTNQ